jgi:hypothetical protein
MLEESWLKALRQYKEAFVERGKLVLQHIFTIRQVAFC